jgi:glycine oxidase
LSSRRIVIVGGGIIGLSIAEHLLREGIQPIVLEKGLFAQEASWAGAGYVDLRDAYRTGGAFLNLCRLSYDLYPGWVKRLKDESGIDPEFLSSGSLGLVFNDSEEMMVREMEGKAAANGLQGEWLSPAEARRREPQLSDRLKSVWYLPQTRQVRPPRLTRALLKVLQDKGAVLREKEEVRGFSRQGNRIIGVETAQTQYEADEVLLAGGAWTKGLSEILGFSIPVRPVRGQVVLFQAEPGLLKHVLFSANAYLVPRLDGRIYVGSTLEEAGFDKSVTAEAVAGLTKGAISALPALERAKVESTWSGLRPGSMDGLPYLGRVPGFDNFWAATGHFTHGILLAAVTGRLMAQALTGKKPELDMDSFALDRQPPLMSGV